MIAELESVEGKIVKQYNEAFERLPQNVGRVTKLKQSIAHVRIAKRLLKELNLR